jgi:hypothetical protein
MGRLHIFERFSALQNKKVQKPTIHMISHNLFSLPGPKMDIFRPFTNNVPKIHTHSPLVSQLRIFQINFVPELIHSSFLILPS